MGEEYHLAAGPHRRPGGGRCAMEWVAHLAGEPHTDEPRTVSPVLAAFARSWNDALDDESRQRLRPYLGRTIGTAGDGHDEWRAWLCADWLVRVCAPALLDHAGLRASAAELRSLAPLTGDEAARRAEPALAVACAAAARARSEAREAAISSPEGARHAARALPRTAGSDAARAAVRSASLPDAEGAAERACRIARDASWAASWHDAPASWASLRPVAESLQRSAFGLLDRMLPAELLLDPLAQPLVAA
jgi:hypothetical protein